MADEQARQEFRLSWRRPSPGNARLAVPPPAPKDWRDTVRTRLVVCAVLFASWTAAIEARLLYLQIFAHAEKVVEAAKMHMNTLEAPARRGDILDRNGRILAYSVDADSIFADPTQIEDHATTARRLCGALDRCTPADRQAIEKNLHKDTEFVFVARKVSPEAERRVRALGLRGIGFHKESGRFYPKREQLSHVLGYVGVDNAGLAGIEFAWDSQIRGRSGTVIIQRDAKRQALTSYIERAATAGASLELTIDQFLQNIAERELQSGVEEYGASGGTAVVMDPNNGEILALANWPTFNPNSYNQSRELARRNRGLQDLYEPGSTFKMITAAAALEEGLIGPDDLIDVSQGYIRFGARQIDDVHRYGVLSFTDVIVKSSNVGAIKVGLQLGPERLGRYVSRFGFGQAIVPDFQGENPGIVWNPARLDSSALASVSMGYQVGVTAVQMATAASSVANGGTLFEPHLVRAMIRGGHRTEVAPKALRRTISTRTAAQLTTIMESVVDRGTAKSARIDGYTIAGKTGTAQKLIDGRYSQSDYNVSFVGFLPSRKPALTIIVMIDSPHGKGDTGGVVAAPIFKRIAEASLRHLRVGPTVNAPPPVLVAAAAVGDDRTATVRQVSQQVVLDTVLEPARDGLMPDLRGLSARDAVRALTSLGMTARMSGDGFVLEQSPAAGVPLGPTVGTLKLGRRPTQAAPSPPQ